MKADIGTTIYLRVEEIGSTLGRKWVTVSGKMGEWDGFTQKLYIGDSLDTRMNIAIDTDDLKKWEKLTIDHPVLHEAEADE